MFKTTRSLILPNGPFLNTLSGHGPAQRGQKALTWDDVHRNPWNPVTVDSLTSRCFPRWRVPQIASYSWLCTSSSASNGTKKRVEKCFWIFFAKGFGFFLFFGFSSFSLVFFVFSVGFAALPDFTIVFFFGVLTFY